jgi:hypothetical protein
MFRRINNQGLYHERKTPKRRITVTSSLNEISARKQGGGERGRRYSSRPHPFLPFLPDTDIKDDVNGFPSISDIYFMVSQ